MPCLLLFLLLACARLPASHAQVIDTPNTLYRIAGGGNFSPHPDGVGPQAKFYRLTAIVNANDRLWVVDQSLHSLRRIDPDGGQVSTVAGRPGFGPTRLGPLPGAIEMPVGIAVIDDKRLAVITEHGEVLGINF